MAAAVAVVADSGRSLLVALDVILGQAPDLFQLTKPEAEVKLRAAGITGSLDIDDHGLCGSVVDHHVIELGRICSQTPGAGMAHGSRISVSVRIQTENPWRGELTGGRHWFLLPEVVGLTVDQARDKLRAAGYSAMDRFQVSYVDDADCKPNIVCRMYPEPMTRSARALVDADDDALRPPRARSG